ncbi:DUF6976 family protein [Celeribacter marinus]|uniref:DUF6976 family protein n=1 Tax=Celeribacter marinus TaxID=1397108 RepID=UPI003F6C61E0
MKNMMMTVAQAAEKIESGAVLVAAGSQEALGQLPKGKWIGGTSVYFVTDEGGKVDRENVFVTEIEGATDARAVIYAGEDLKDLTMNRFDNGMSMILIPAFSKAHEEFAIHGTEFSGLFDQPLMGWVTGVHLDDVGKVTPKVFDGATGEAYDEGAALLHVEIAADKVATIDILNLFEQDEAADLIEFDTDGFSAKVAKVNGKDVDLAAYIADNKIDTQLPLVANYAGAMVNVSFQAVDPAKGVDFYAPVVSGVEYRLAKSPGAYAEVFAANATGNGTKELSCNCILNYLYGELEGKVTGSFTGPATFGEIAYILLNQTMVRLDVQAKVQSTVA